MTSSRLPVLNRSCGECNACCVVFDIDELHKPAREACQYLDGNCSIYSTRPPICVDFECAWLQGGLPDDQRPDKFGVIFDVTRVGPDIILQATEVHDGAMLLTEYDKALTYLVDRYLEVNQIDIHPIGEPAFGLIPKRVKA